MTTRRHRILKENLQAFGFLAPAFTVLLVFWFVPVVLAFFFSFTDIQQGDPLFSFGGEGRGTYKWIGLGNYSRLFQSSEVGGDRDVFFKAFFNTLNWVIWTVPMTLGFSLSLAMLLNQRLRGVNFFRTIFFLPHITTWVAIALVWKMFYNEHFGIANYLLKTLFGMAPFAWLNEPRGVIQMGLEALGMKFDGALHPLLAGPSLAMLAIVFTSAWYNAGYFMVIFLAGLQNIDRANYEAAQIDGATARQQFFYITLPLLSPVIFFLVTISLINAFKEFASMFIMTPTGGPDKSTTTMVLFLYDRAFGRGQDLGYGAAIAFVLLGIILGVTLIQKFLTGKMEHHE